MSRPERTSGAVSATSRTSAANSESSATGPRSAPGPCYDGEVVVRALPKSRPRGAFNGVKVFSATKFAERDRLGERVTQWLAEHEHAELDAVDMIVTQSSDAEFHCVTITVFYWQAIAARAL